MNYLSTRSTASFLLFFFSLTTYVYADNESLLYRTYQNACAESEEGIKKVSLFTKSIKKSGPITGKIRYVEYLEIDDEIFNTIENEKPAFLDLEVFYKAKISVLKMQKVSIGNYRLLNSKNEELPTNPNLVFYRGYIEGSTSSFATVSFLDDRVNIVYSNGKGNHTISKEGQEYISYADVDHLADKSFDCGAEALYSTKIDKIETQATTIDKSMTGACVEVYIEADNDAYIKNGNSITNTETWVTSIFNNVGALYTNSSVPTGISIIKVWDTVDPYSSINSTGGMLSSFKTQNPSYTGALAHLFSTRSVGGGVAYVNGLCSSFGYAVSGGMSSSTTAYPNYSWNVNVVAHEMGHNMGSNHTHDCVWNGNNTQIDDCGPVAGYDTSNPCYNSVTPILPTSGTIMSYCHLLNSGPNAVGIDFANGFGPLPGALILNSFNTAACNTGSCTTTGPTCTDGIQNGDETGIDCGGTLCISCPPPANNDCAGAIDLSSNLNGGKQIFTQANELANSSDVTLINQNYGEACNTYGSWCNYTVNNDIWYKVSIPNSAAEFGVLTVDLLGTTYDTQLAIYTNCNGNELAANDDFYGNADNWVSKCSAAVTPGNIYYIQIDGFNNNATGDLHISIEYTPINSAVNYNTGAVLADVEAADEFGYTHYVNKSLGVVLLSVKKNGQDIGWLDIDNNFSCEVKAFAGSSNLGLNGCGAPYTNNNDWIVMNRTWDLSPSTQPTVPLLVKTYYTALDYNEISTAISDINSHDDLTHYKISSPGNEDLTALGNACHQTVSSANYTEYEYPLGEYTYGLFSADYFAEYLVSSFSGGGGGGGGGTSAQGALPLDLINIEARAYGSNNLIQWSTAAETNVAFQSIEKSENGKTWEALSVIDSDGDKTTKSDYQTIDKEPYTTSYYRLKVTDLDGSIDYSTIVSVLRAEEGFPTRAFPNPTSGIIQVSSKLLETDASINLYDLHGRAFNKQSYSMNYIGELVISLDLSELPDGIYPLVIEYGDQREIIKLTKF